MKPQKDYLSRDMLEFENNKVYKSPIQKFIIKYGIDWKEKFLNKVKMKQNPIYSQTNCYEKSVVTCERKYGTDCPRVCRLCDNIEDYNGEGMGLLLILNQMKNEENANKKI